MSDAGSRFSSATLLTPSPAHRPDELRPLPPDPCPCRAGSVPSIDADQCWDIYHDTIEICLKRLGVTTTSALRPHQASAIAHALNDEDIFLSLATGAGKSLCFQIPALVRSQGQNKVTVVLLPTLDIIRRQVEALRARDVVVEIVASLNPHSDRDTLAQRIKAGYRPALIYSTPDTFCGFYSYIFDILHDARGLDRIVLDEGHTIVHWSNFKPVMDDLRLLRARYPRVPITIATATLTPSDRDRLLSHLSIPVSVCRMISGSLDRPNLHYSVKPIHSFRHKPRMKAIVDFMSLHRLTAESGLIYCSTSSHCLKVVADLNAVQGDQYASAIYGENRAPGKGMTKEARQKAIEQWMAGKTKVLVATLSFGMGIDKSHVTFVFHYDVPVSFESYLQETGRAGRDGSIAYCLLVYSWQDIQRALFYEGRNHPSGTETATERLLSMSHYAHTVTTCRHTQILSYLGAPASELTPCGTKCDNCVGQPFLNKQDVTELAENSLRVFATNSLPDDMSRGVEKTSKALREMLQPAVGHHLGKQRMRDAANSTTIEAMLNVLLAHGILRAYPYSKKGEPLEEWSQSLTIRVNSGAVAVR